MASFESGRFPFIKSSPYICLWEKENENKNIYMYRLNLFAGPLYLVRRPKGRINAGREVGNKPEFF